MGIHRSPRLKSSCSKLIGSGMAFRRASNDFLLEQLEERIFYNPMMKSHEIKDRFIAGNVIAKAEWIENQVSVELH